MTWGYRIAAGVVFGLLGLTFYAAVHGWGLRSDADAIAQAKGQARTGSLHLRRYYGGGPRYGK